MQFVVRGGRTYACFPRLAQVAGLVHAFSTRGLDVGLRNDERADERTANRATFAADWDLDPHLLHPCEQVHQTRIALVDGTQPGRLPAADGVATAAPGAALMTFSADCPLVIVVDPRRRALGMVHASWRCTTAQLLTRLVELMRQSFDCAPADLLAGVGPGAGPDAYEVGEDVVTAARGLPGVAQLFKPHGDRWLFDLWEANRQQLLAAGVPADQIEIAGLCTMTETERFYSFRREGPGCGHFGLLAAWQPA